jgi:hypothetical protein
MLTTTKPPKCKHCKQRVEFVSHKIHPGCVDAWLVAQNAKQQAKKAKADRAETKRRKEDAKTVTDLKADAQKEVNAFVRARDHGLPCISCGKAWQPDFQAGHYRSRGAAGHLALDPRNIHGQCVHCNLHKHSNAVEYRIRLVERCGVALVEALECDNETVKLDRDTLRQLKTIYRAKARDLKKAQA